MSNLEKSTCPFFPPSIDQLKSRKSGHRTIIGGETLSIVPIVVGPTDILLSSFLLFFSFIRCQDDRFSGVTPSIDNDV